MNGYTPDETAVIDRAVSILHDHVCKGTPLDSPCDAARYLQVKLAPLDYEVSGMVMLDCQNKVIEVKEMFRGTLTMTHTYPREVVKAALDAGADSVVLFHNHPSGDPTPSPQDFDMTKRMMEALKVISVDVLDHIIVAKGGTYSMREHDEMSSPKKSGHRSLADLLGFNG